MIGTGSIGLFFAALFARQGHDLILVSRRNCALFEKEGIRILHATGDAVQEEILDPSHFHCVSDTSLLEEIRPDLLFLSTKSSANRDILNQIKSLS